MSNLTNLVTEKNILLNMSDEDYINQSYGQYINDTYSFIRVILEVHGTSIENMNRSLAIALISQAIIIYSVVLY